MDYNTVKKAGLPSIGSTVKITKINGVDDDSIKNHQIGTFAIAVLDKNLAIGERVTFMMKKNNKNSSLSIAKRIDFVDEGIVNVVTENSTWQIKTIKKLPAEGDNVRVTKTSQTSDLVRGGGELGTSTLIKLVLPVIIGSGIHGYLIGDELVDFNSTTIKDIQFTEDGITYAETENSIWKVEISK